MAKRGKSPVQGCAVQPSQGAAATPASERTCLVCRRRVVLSRLVALERFALEGLGEVVVARDGTRRGRSGRRAYVCVARNCLLGLDVKSVRRAFKECVEPLDIACFIDDLHGQAQRYVVECIGLAQRARMLDIGVERLCGERKTDGFCILASDLAQRSRLRLAYGHSFLSGENLGRAAGLGAVGAMRIRAGRLAQRAAYWFSVWSETHSPQGRGALEGGAAILLGVGAMGHDKGFSPEVA